MEAFRLRSEDFGGGGESPAQGVGEGTVVGVVEVGTGILHDLAKGRDAGMHGRRALEQGFDGRHAEAFVFREIDERACAPENGEVGGIVEAGMADPAGVRGPGQVRRGAADPVDFSGEGGLALPAIQELHGEVGSFVGEPAGEDDDAILLGSGRSRGSEADADGDDGGRGDVPAFGVVQDLVAGEMRVRQDDVGVAKRRAEGGGEVRGLGARDGMWIAVAVEFADDVVDVGGESEARATKAEYGGKSLGENQPIGPGTGRGPDDADVVPENAAEFAAAGGVVEGAGDPVGAGREPVEEGGIGEDVETFDLGIGFFGEGAEEAEGEVENAEGLGAGEVLVGDRITEAERAGVGRRGVHGFDRERGQEP